MSKIMYGSFIHLEEMFTLISGLRAMVPPNCDWKSHTVKSIQKAAEKVQTLSQKDQP